MIGTETVDRVIGSDVYDEAGSKIGSASEVYLDDETGQPEWVTVRTGLFGTKETFIPIRDADLTDDGLRVAISKERVKDAPRVDADGHLSPQEEQELYRYYGLGGQQAAGTTDAPNATMTDATPTNATPTTETTARTDTTGQQLAGGADLGSGRSGAEAPVGRDTSGPTTDSAMTRSEERLNVGTRTEESGRARLRKYVVSENVTQTVPVSHEEVRIQREPITDANVGDALDGPGISEEEHEVTLHAERAVVDKQTVPVERVRLDTETVTGQEQVSADLQREEVEIDDAAGGRRS